jgi:hypothetical protein
VAELRADNSRMLGEKKEADLLRTSVAALTAQVT